ncbi:hypothetical protein IGS74_18920 [Aureimonas sp. OT7]|uniref:hypothetical protein n=1 Tax=Aureimonas sp. OT7 TaxID=2816454 RepID=UPI00177A7F0C|nr:hypothetical protein [Aureimonas sp. OT7]QOG06555.1 hypothetical protein IGS74_18920 [Aureimonas sp. OT7]
MPILAHPLEGPLTKEPKKPLRESPGLVDVGEVLRIRHFVVPRIRQRGDLRPPSDPGAGHPVQQDDRPFAHLEAVETPTGERHPPRMHLSILPPTGLTQMRLYQR